MKSEKKMPLGKGAERLFKREHVAPILMILLFSSFLVLLVEGREKPGFGSWIWGGVDTESEYFKYIEESNYEIGYQKGYEAGFKDGYAEGCKSEEVNMGFLAQKVPAAPHMALIEE